VNIKMCLKVSLAKDLKFQPESSHKREVLSERRLKSRRLS